MTTIQKAPSGQLFTSNVIGLRNLIVDAEIMQITRAGVDIPNATLVRNLAPSHELFNTFNTEWRHLPPDYWWHKYEKQFLEELNTKDKLNCLRGIYKKLLAGENVVLVCFCKNHNYCHRKLVGDFFKPYGIVAKELNPVESEQLFFILE